MSRKRNPEATCETCPYWDGGKDSHIANCRRYSHFIEVKGDMTTDTYVFPSSRSEHWCGEHPNFFLNTESSPNEEKDISFPCEECGSDYITKQQQPGGWMKGWISHKDTCSHKATEEDEIFLQDGGPD